MENIFLLATVISITYFIAKFIEMRFVDKESKPLKFLIRDTLLVYFSVIVANFILEQITPIIQSGGTKSNNTQIFIDDPGF